MKTSSYFFIITLTLLIVYSCDKDNNGNYDLTINGALINNSDCKNLKSARLDFNISNSSSCINYVFDASANKLNLTHINAGFNCCPDSIYCVISLNSDTIIIQEFEKNFHCNCCCLYDLEIEINGIDTKKYKVKLIEPYSGEQEKIIFKLNLNRDIEGSYCVTRNKYPWGE